MQSHTRTYTHKRTHTHARYHAASKKKHLIFVLNSVIGFVVVFCYLFVTDSFVGIGILTALLGCVHQAWFGIIWTLIYELFPPRDAPTVSGYFFFCCSVAALVFPSIMSAILSGVDASASVSASQVGRSYGNRVVLVFILTLMAVSILVQIAMFVAKKRSQRREEKTGAEVLRT